MSIFNNIFIMNILLNILHLLSHFLLAEDSFRESENRAESHSGSWSIYQ